VKIIYLNGASSSGKTSISRELQNILPEYYLVIGIDIMIYMMPERTNNFSEPAEPDGFTWQNVTLKDGTPGMRVVSGKFGKKINHSYHSVVQTLLSAGHNLIIDDVAEGISDVQIWIDELENHSFCTVGVFCSLEELQRREVARKDRKVGSAAEQFYRVHEGVEYNVKVHSDVMTAKECAQQIANHSFLNST
jgi:chloramphenicol 3-O phosphotransferase